MDTLRSDPKHSSRVVTLLLGAVVGAVVTASVGLLWLRTRAAPPLSTTESSQTIPVPNLPRPDPDEVWGAFSSLSVGQKRTLSALEKVVTLQFKQLPIIEALDVVRESNGVDCHLDLPMNERDQLGSKVITWWVEQTPLGEVLDLLSDGLGLEYGLAEDGIVLCQHEKIAEHMYRVTYPVSDLIERPWGDTEQRKLREVIESAIDPSSWSDRGGSGTLAMLGSNETMTVLQTHRNQQAIQMLLRELRVPGTWPDCLASWRVYSHLNLLLSPPALPEDSMEKAIEALQAALGVPIEMDSRDIPGVDPVAL